MPVLLLGGSDSPLQFAGTLDRLQACLAHPERGLIADSGHAMPRLQPAQFNSAVLGFITRHSQDRS